MMKHILAISITATFLFSCSQTGKNTYPQSAEVPSEVLLAIDGMAPVMMGGYGSSMAFDPADSLFYLLTDRGPNVDGPSDESKVFPLPEYSPTVGKFRLSNGSLELVEKITLRDSDGTPFNGLPNSEGDGVTGETSYDMDGEKIIDQGRGIDPEGLTLAADGTFWVSDEYGPFIMQFDRTGKMIREFKPGQVLPEYYAKRRPNRGMEGLTLSKDGRFLYGIMQSPLYLPDESTKGRSVNNRIVEIDLQNYTTREFLYCMDSPGNVVSELCYVNDSTVLVLERDDKFPANGTGVKLVYRMDLRGASDISGKTIETMSEAELSSNAIFPARKSLFFDIVEQIPSYSHDKPEGIEIIGDSVLCIINDDDFGITKAADGTFLPKEDANGNTDRTVVYFEKVFY